MRRPASIFAVIFLLIVSTSLCASAKEKWIRVESKNFTLLGNAGEGDIRAVARQLETFREVFSKVFPNFTVVSSIPTRVIVFKDDAYFSPFKLGSNTAGFFQSGEDVNYITISTQQRGEKDAFNIIFHEYSHLLTLNNKGEVPAWFSEGLAEYYSTFRTVGDQKAVFGYPIAHHVYLLRQRQMLPLRELFQVDSKSAYYNEKAKQSVFYAQSWALVHYLTLGRGGNRTMEVVKFVDQLIAKVPLEQAFKEAFGMTIAQMETHLHDYINRDRYPVVLETLENKLTLAQEMQATPVTEAESLAYLGDLLLHGQRGEGVQYLNRALALEPNLSLAHESLGILRIREGKVLESLAHFAKATDSANHLAHYYYAYALSREGMFDPTMVTNFAPGNVPKMREHLKRAIELRPDYLDTYGLLAFVNLVTKTQIPESIEMLRGILAKAPDRTDLMFMLAQLYQRQDEYQAAREILQKVVALKPEQLLLERSESLLKQIIVEEKEYLAATNAPPPNKDEVKLPVMPEADSENKPAPVPELDESYFLREALMKPAENERQVGGFLVRVDCDTQGIVLIVREESRLFRLRAPTLRSIERKSFSQDAGREITCGPRRPDNNVVVIYAPQGDAKAKTDGIAKSIQFVPRDFELIPKKKS